MRARVSSIVSYLRIAVWVFMTWRAVVIIRGTTLQFSRWLQHRNITTQCEREEATPWLHIPREVHYPLPDFISARLDSSTTVRMTSKHLKQDEAIIGNRLVIIGSSSSVAL